MAPFTILRAVFGYLFLVFIVPIVGRRTGKQVNSFDFILLLYLAGLILIGMVGDEVSLSNVLCQILAVTLCHYLLAWLRLHYAHATKLLDGVALILLEENPWRTDTLSRMRTQGDDIMDMARSQGLKDLSPIQCAVRESFGEITIVPVPKKAA
jgi:uncharacterized membrane protein YcaP (DUF421 family)